MSAPEDQTSNQAVERLRLEMEKGFGALRAEMERGSGVLRAEMEKGSGVLRAEMEKGSGALRAEMERGFGSLRAEMIDRDAALLKWSLVYAATQIGVIAALLTLSR